jgi:hypothetical protein
MCNCAKKKEIVQTEYNMTPPKFGTPGKYVRMGYSTGIKEEGMDEGS